MNNKDTKDLPVDEPINDISSCWECAVKHVTCARVEYFEYLQDNESIKDLMWCIGDLACAEKHLISIDDTVASVVREIRKLIMQYNIPLAEVDDMVLAVCEKANLFKERDAIGKINAETN